MNMHEEDLQLIEKYIDGELDGKALADFHARMEADVEFAQAVRMEEDIMESIELWGNKELKNKLEKIGEEEIGNAEIKNINTRRRKFLWAAAAVLGLAVIAKFALHISPPSPEKLYADYAAHEFNFTEKGNNAKLINTAENKLAEKQYGEALPLLEKLTALDAQNNDFQLALGICHLEVNDYEKALSIFSELETNAPLYIGEAKWYKALVFLKKGDLGESLQLLAEIPESSSRKKDATRLAKEISKLN